MDIKHIKKIHFVSENKYLLLTIFGLSSILVLPKLIFLILTFFKNIPYPFSNTIQSFSVSLMVLLSTNYLFFSFVKVQNYSTFWKNAAGLLKALVVMYCLSLFLDIGWLFEKGYINKAADFLDQAILSLLIETKINHLFFLTFLLVFTVIRVCLEKKMKLSLETILTKLVFAANCMALLTILLTIGYVTLYWHSIDLFYSRKNQLISLLSGSFITIQILFLVIVGICYKSQSSIQRKIISLTLKQGQIQALFTATASILLILPAFIESHKLRAPPFHIFFYFKVHAIFLSKIFLPMILMLLVFYRLKKSASKIDSVQKNKTSGEFGSADFARKKDLEKEKLYDNNSYILSGKDEVGGDIFLPLKNKLTISPQGGGKTSCSTVNVLLSHPGNTFVFDIKGELWATTARYRHRAFNKEVVVLDPYQVTKGQDFAKGKPESLLKEYCFNPFDWIPEHQGMRDRMINAFASSFIINDGGTSTHFDDNAKILIRGYIDYMMQGFPKEKRNLEMLYQLLSEDQDGAKQTYQEMGEYSGRAGAAANQINRVGLDEKGSILSTSYRQIDWMSDYNIKACLSHSNFDLSQFISGNMDIYVVLPEDQIKEHQRFVRMLLSLIMSFIVQTDPSQLPQHKMLFLLDELAQLGYCPDVEQAIEVLRARKLVVWTVFQTLSQIKLYKKPDLFMGAPIKQVFTNDDVETMQWVQSLGGKKTILTKTLSNNEGDSRQKMQLIGGSVSTGEGESVQETGVDLIHINQIRELKEDEQFIFMHGLRPIKCKKVRYFEHTFFKGKFDVNPLEASSSNDI